MGSALSLLDESATPTQPYDVYPRGNSCLNPTGNPYVNPTGNPYVNPTGNPYSNPTGNPIICVKNIWANGKIDPRAERENIRILNEFLNNLLLIMQKDRDFRGLYQKLYYTGSYYENLRISDPNEFDINVILKLPFRPGERNFEYAGTTVKSYMKYKLKTTIENNNVLWDNVDLIDTLFEGEYLSPVKVRRWMQGIVDRARPLVPKPNGVRNIIPSASGPAKTIILETDYGYDIDIDLVPVIQFAFPEWPRDARNNMLNAFQIRNEDCFWFLVPKEFPASRTNVNPIDAKRLWRIHFPEIEKKIIHNRGQVKPLIKLLKALRDNEGWHILASYYLKTIVLWMVEEHPSPDYWKENNIYIRLIEALEALKESVRKRFIGYYFYPDFNLIQKMGQSQADNICNRLDRILRDIQGDPESLETYFQILSTEWDLDEIVGF